MSDPAEELRAALLAWSAAARDALVAGDIDPARLAIAGLATFAHEVATQDRIPLSNPGREAMAEQADNIDLLRLGRALTVMGCAGPVGQEDCAVRLADYVNRLTLAVERFSRG